MSDAAPFDLAALVEAFNRCHERQWGHNLSAAEEWVHEAPTLDSTGISFLCEPVSALERRRAVSAPAAARDRVVRLSSPV